MAKFNDKSNIIASNRRARLNYKILDTINAGIALQGSEIKSVRNRAIDISHSYVRLEKGEAWLINCYIAEYSHASLYSKQDLLRPRKLLLHKREVSRITGLISQQGLTAIPLAVFLRRHLVKLSIGIGKGLKQHDKRDIIRKRASEREMHRAKLQ